MKNWDFDYMVQFMDDEIREQVHAELAPCTKAEFYARYCELDPQFKENMEATLGEDRIARALEE